ncbi:MAG: M23 family metallopeptidase [Bacteroidales bacterium]|nr:M23 family metallopeptidase [Bacteroidales bacterium]
MRTRPFLLCLLVLPLLCACHSRTPRAALEQKDTILPLGFLTDTLQRVQTQVRNGETFTELMTRLGLGAGDAYTLASRCDTLFDVRRLRAGNGVDAYYYGDSLQRRLHYVVYANDRIRSTVFRCCDSLALWRVEKEVQVEDRYTDVTIATSLWNDMIAAGASPELILELADIYAWTVDFFGLQTGDRFRAFYRQRVCEGEPIDIAGVDFAVFDRGKTRLYALRYDQGDRGNCYWNEKGESMRKAFLKAPLKFSRISSRFSYHRVHPVHGVVRPHTAVDYAAPAGTPVHALGDGVVLSAGRGSGGAGNMIKIRHNSVYTTAYLHLRGFAKGIKAGVRVQQGQTIGYVGMTGTATGPHLDFRVWKNGTPIDPLKLESPSAEPIKSENKPALDSLFQVYSARLETL